MERLILSEQGYREQMENVVKPYLDIRKSVLWPEREEGKKIYCERYLADSPKGVVMISHGFTETAEKYKEVIYYFVKKQYHVYLPEYCGHGRSYRLIPDSSLIYVDDYQRYVNDFLYVAKMAAKENPGLPVFLYGLLGGGLAERRQRGAGAFHESGAFLSDDPSCNRKYPVAGGKTDRFRCVPAGKRSGICSRTASV